MVSKTATKDISERTKPETFTESKKVAKRGGSIAGNARRELEEELGESVITSKNATQLNTIVTELIQATAEEA